MNDKQFDALIEKFNYYLNMREEQNIDLLEMLDCIRFEIRSFKDIYALANGIETSEEAEARISRKIKDGTVFDD